MAAKQTAERRPPFRRRVIHRHQVDDDDHDRCSREYGETLDIKSIATRFMKTGKAPQTDREALYGDFSNADDYLTAKNKIASLLEAYERLPYEVRDTFKGPEDLMRFVEQDRNLDAALDLELITVEEHAARTGTEVPVEPRTGTEVPVEPAPAGAAAEEAAPPSGGEDPQP